LEPAVIAALVMGATALVGSVLAFWGVRVKAGQERDIAIFSKNRDSDAKQAELAVAVEHVEIDRAKIALDGFERLNLQLLAELARRDAAHKLELDAREQKHRDEIEPVRRYAEALKAAENEGLFEIALFLEKKRQLERVAREVLAERREMSEVRAESHRLGVLADTQGACIGHLEKRLSIETARNFSLSNQVAALTGEASLWRVVRAWAKRRFARRV
jgi:hypothetical protein